MVLLCHEHDKMSVLVVEGYLIQVITRHRMHFQSISDLNKKELTGFVEFRKERYLDTLRGAGIPSLRRIFRWNRRLVRFAGF
jgi:hypothetical protein